MKTVLLFGAGKSATVLIDYLIENAADNNWKVVIADADKNLILAKTNNNPIATAIQVDITNNEQRSLLIQQADIVISMMPPSLHILIADDCILFSKNLLTASYISEDILNRKSKIENEKLLFLCEMGLDPGIDHMSAMKIIDDIHKQGGTVTSFKSHCGGLVAPESDDNPWHYKISWNPKNIIMAGKAGAIYKINGAIVKENYEELFEVERGVNFDDEIGFLSYYPNRDSLGYIDIYGLQSAATFVRTTLRYPDFMYGWNNIIELNLTDEDTSYDTTGMSIARFFKTHFENVHFSSWLTKKMEERLAFTKNLAQNLEKLLEAEEKREDAKNLHPAAEDVEQFSFVDEAGNLQVVNIDEMKNRAATAMATKMHEANLTLKQLFYLGMDDDETLINKGTCTVAEILQFIAEKKLSLLPGDKDMIAMLHEIEYELNGKKHTINSSLKVMGADSLRTAMAKTVGLPLGIAAKLILNGTIQTKGLHIPTNKEIYLPVLAELEKNGICFNETKSNL
ncbi:MAG: saccharopine dehydrogenase NADP-binding domain-containing protein [Chitinophagaceae bacterium]|nr:saccharopine dehydrogenase NADP-binding domain-containing protein [Chitinophagaceae bacterium]